MSTTAEVKKDEAPNTDVLDEGSKKVVVSGREYSCACEGRKVFGLMALVGAAVALIFAVIFAAGVFGGGEMGIIAGGLTVGSMVSFAIAAALLIPKQENMFVE